MPRIDILILEKDSSFASAMKIGLSKWGRVNVVIFKQIKEALEYSRDHKIDLFIVRTTIEESGDGIHFGQQVANLTIPLVYIAEQEDGENYEKAKQLNLLTFLVRPFDLKTLYAALNLYFNNEHHFLIIKKGKENIRIKYNHILWIRSSGNYCIIRTNQKEYSFKSSLTKLKETLQDSNFIQIHRAFIVGIDKIDDINVKSNIVNIKGTQLPIGRKYRKSFFDKIEVI